GNLCGYSSRAFLYRLSGAVYRLDDSRIGPAAAEMSVHRGADLRVRWLWSFSEKFRSFDNHTVVAIPALQGLLVDHGLLDGMELGRLRQLLLRGVKCRQSFERCDGLALDCGDFCQARARLYAIHEHGAR